MTLGSAIQDPAAADAVPAALTSQERPLVTEMIKLQDVDSAFPELAAIWAGALAYQSSEIDLATLWTLCRTGHVTLQVSRRGTTLISATAWRFERWANETVLRCVSHVGVLTSAKRWLPEHIELAKEAARIGGASRLLWEAGYPEPTGEPDEMGFKVLRRTLTIAV